MPATPAWCPCGVGAGNTGGERRVVGAGEPSEVGPDCAARPSRLAERHRRALTRRTAGRGGALRLLGGAGGRAGARPSLPPSGREASDPYLGGRRAEIPGPQVPLSPTPGHGEGRGVRTGQGTRTGQDPDGRDAGARPPPTLTRTHANTPTRS